MQNTAGYIRSITEMFIMMVIMMIVIVVIMMKMLTWERSLEEMRVMR